MRQNQSFMPRYDNRYWLDVTLAAWLLLVGGFIFALYEAVVLYIDYENSCSQYLCGSVGIVLASATIFLLASCWFVLLSYPEQLEHDLACVEEFAVIDSIEKRKSFGERFIWGSSLLMLMWLFLLALLPLYVLVIWAYTSSNISVLYFVSYFLFLIFVTLVLLFWITATFPENMIKNNGQGSSYFYDLCLSCCCGEKVRAANGGNTNGSRDDEELTCSSFWQKHTGSDFLVGSWVFFGGAGLVLAVSVYYVYEEWTNVLIYFVLLSAILLFLGSALLVSSSYPGAFFSRFWWCTLTCQTDERWNVQRGRDSGYQESRRLI